MYKTFNEDASLYSRTSGILSSRSCQRILSDGRLESILTIFFLAELIFENLFSNLTQILPYCGHGMDLLCGTSVSEAVCPEMCGMTLDCGHTCPLPCHKRSSHEQIQCPQPCQRTCPEQHPCKKKCFEDCRKCFTQMTKLLPCGHEVSKDFL